MKEVKFKEHGFTLDLKNEEAFVSKQIYEKLKLLNTSRSLALTSLLALSQNKTGKISAFDGFAGLGMAPLQWTSLLNDEQIDISMNMKSVMKNIFEDEEKIPQALKRCRIFYEDTNVLLHQNRFDFIYLAPLFSPLQYLEAAFRSISNNGIIVLTVCDLAVLTNRDPEATYKLYGSMLHKTEYMAEIGVRMIVFNMVRAAAKFNKALDVKSCAVSNAGITVVCEVKKDTKLVGQCSKLIKHVAHCSESKQWRFVNQSKYLNSMVEADESFNFQNKKLNPVLLLGPVYSGTIFDTKFIYEQCKVLYKVAYSKYILHLFKNLLIESICPSHFNAIDDRLNKLENCVPYAKKDFYESLDKVIEARAKTSNNCWSMKTDEVAMYFDIQARSVPASGPPSLNTVVNKLRSMGYRACKSSFGSRKVRTNAVIDEKVFNELYKNR